MCFGLGTELLAKKTSFGYQDGVNSRVVDRCQRKPFKLPSDDRTYGMKRTSESEDRVGTECDGNERLL